MAQQTVTDLIVQDKSAEGIASYVRGMRNAQRARDDLTDTEMAAQRAQQKSTATMLGLSDSTNRTRQAWQRLKEGIDPVTRAQREFETAALRSDAALRRGLATQNEVNRVLQVYKQRLRETQQAQREPSAFTGAAQGALQGFAGRSAVGGALAGLGTGVGVAAAGATVAALAGATAAVVSYGDAWVGLGNRLKAAGVSTAELATEQQKVVDIAMSSRSELTATNDLYSKFIGVTQTLGVSQDKAAIATKAVTQALTLGGISASQATGTIIQLGQALGSGVLRGDEFNSVMEGLGAQSPIIKAIAAEFGVATTELRGLAEAGELVSDRVFKAIIEAQPQIEAAFKAMDPTLDGAWNNAWTAATKFFGVVNEGVGASNMLAAALLKVAEGANAAADGLRKAGAVDRANADFARQMREKYGVFGSNMYDNAATNQEYQDKLLLNRRLFPGGRGPGRRPSGPASPYGGPDEAVRGGSLSELTSRQIWYPGMVLPPPRPASEKGEREGYLYNDVDDPTKMKKTRTPRATSTRLTPEERGENAFERALAEQQRRNELLANEADYIGKSAAERERSETIINLESKAMEANRLARKADISVTEEQRRAILAMADATAQATQRLEEAKEAEKDRIAAMDDLRDTTKGIFSDIGHGIAQGKSGKEILRGLMGKIGGQLIDTGAQNLTDSLFGKQGKGAGGLLGGLFGGGQRGASPANPVFVASVSPGLGGVGGAIGAVPSLADLFMKNPSNPAAAINAPTGSVPSLADAFLNKAGGADAGGLFKGATQDNISMAAYIRESAIRHGIDPNIAVKVARAEGLAPGVWQSKVYQNGMREPSYGPFQLLKGGPGTGFPRGMGNLFQERTGLDPADPANARAGVDFALGQASQKGWGQWYGAKSWGISNFQGIGRNGWKGASADPMGGFGQNTMAGGAGVDQLAKLTPAVQQLGTAAQQTTPALGSVTDGFGSLGSSLSSLGSMIGQGVGGQKGGSIGGGIGGIFSSIFGGLFGGGAPVFGTGHLFANGGIMTPRGPMPLVAYAGGGVVDRPQVRIAGEGSMNEAIVPLPNGRSIPVQMRGGGRRANRAMPSWRGGDTHITVQGNADEKTLNEMQRQIAASEARQRADLNRNFNRYQATNAAQWADSD